MSSMELVPNKETQLDETTINPVASLPELNVYTDNLENALSWIEWYFIYKTDYMDESFADFESGDGTTSWKIEIGQPEKTDSVCHKIVKIHYRFVDELANF